MKKEIISFVSIILLVLCALVAYGGREFILSNPDIDVPKGGSNTVTLTAFYDNATQPGINIYVQKICRETSAPDYKCNTGDIMNPAEVTVTVSSPTDLNGQATVNLTHDGSSTIGEYHYTLCDYRNGMCFDGGAKVTGDFSVPEFTAISSALALLGAGAVYFFRRRK